VGGCVFHEKLFFYFFKDEKLFLFQWHIIILEFNFGFYKTNKDKRNWE